MRNEMVGRYSGETYPLTGGDFVHQTVTQSTFLLSDSKFTVLDDVREAYTGWLGDVVLGGHSMGLPDVLSDLDAVNMSNLMRDNDIDYAHATAQYYDGIRDGTIDRDKMFLTYTSFEQVRYACASIVTRPGSYITEAELEQKLREEYGDIYTFYMRMKEAHER